MSFEGRKPAVPGGKEVPAPQVAALCWRANRGRVEILLVTSRDTGRWIVPKGWPVPGLAAHEAAAREAWEEAGVEGKVRPVSVGLYSYLKAMGPEEGQPCIVEVFPLRVRNLAEDFPEKGQRRRKWFRPRKAAARVDEPDLQAIIRGFSPIR